MESLRDKIIGRLTNYRQLTSTEQSELDTLAVALDLNENDPMWGQIGWAWAVMPRKEDFLVANAAMVAEVRSDLRTAFLEQVSGKEKEENSIGGAHDATDATAKDAQKQSLDELKVMIQAIADRPAPAAAPATPVVDQKMIHLAILSALEKQKGGMISVDMMMNTIKTAAHELVGWTAAVVAAIVVGICLFIGFQFGEHVQFGNDDEAVQKVEKQNGVLEQQITALTKSVGRR